ncbi:MAG: cobalt-precorrin-6A reductase [Oscillatoria sp. PMC 1068.18]|nr:cobalt-precorrin-6A reductase [Oscillatoria sp. PMC 1076.18]MEC4989151.1 cobalt-precorrin-6A reductase [Oscillatoria sp. PMC 1068.18]
MATVKGQVWLIGGTSESVAVAVALAHQGLACTITVATTDAVNLYPQSRFLRVLVGGLTGDRLKSFLQSQQIRAIVDATHPFATQISTRAIAAAAHDNLPYLRYERPLTKSLPQNKNFVKVNNFETLLAQDYLLGERVLLTVGAKNLPLFQPWQEKASLFARILPKIQSLEVALAAGFSSDRLIALRPPISAELEQALWEQWQISVVVTKASGQAGGEDIKAKVAAKLGIKLIVIARPKIVYPQQTSDLQEVIAFCSQEN